MIITAQRCIFIQSPYFILDASIAEALKAAALSGVEVKVMLTERVSGNRVPGYAGNTFIMDVVSAGVRVFMYRKGYLHAKTITIDSEVCSIGSANIDIRSSSINHEVTEVLYRAALSAQLENDIAPDLQHCVEFDPVEYSRRNVAVGSFGAAMVLDA